MINDRWILLARPEPISLHIREWRTDQASASPAFVLLHGLASNASTWDGVAAILAAQGHRVVAVDQRGHGLSDKPDAGYDFATVVDDLKALLETLELKRPVVVGQSWGANVVLAFGATYPEAACGLGFVDGGYLDLQMRPDGTWNSVERDLKPPALAGLQAEALEARLRQAHPDWSDAGIRGTMANFEVLPDGSIRPWLSLDNHMRILRALWEQRPSALYPRINTPVYIAVAEDERNPSWMAVKRKQVAAAEAGLANIQVERFPSTDHDIHVQKPDKLADSLLAQFAGRIGSGVNKR